MTYWLPERTCTGNLPVSSVYSLLIWQTRRNTSQDALAGSAGASLAEGGLVQSVDYCLVD
jgi:hypothetical protein